VPFTPANQSVHGSLAPALGSGSSGSFLFREGNAVAPLIGPNTRKSTYLNIKPRYGLVCGVTYSSSGISPWTPGRLTRLKQTWAIKLSGGRSTFWPSVLISATGKSQQGNIFCRTHADTQIGGKGSVELFSALAVYVLVAMVPYLLTKRKRRLL